MAEKADLADKEKKPIHRLKKLRQVLRSPRGGALLTAALILVLLGASAAAFLTLTRPGRQLLTRYGSALLESAARSCVPGDPLTCPVEQICVAEADSLAPGKATTFAKRAQCVPRYAGSTPFLAFPFKPEHPVRCTQGPFTFSEKRDEVHSHLKETTLYAVDLSTPAGAASGEVFAAIDGTALVFDECQPLPRNATDDQRTEARGCGAGLGNHVRIFDASRGLMVLYAHLAQVKVQESQQVRQGDLIGVEGSTGDTSGRKLHFSAHYGSFKPWLESLAFYRSNPGALPPAIPFETQFCDPKLKEDCRRSRVRVEQLPCGERPPLLRADWR